MAETPEAKRRRHRRAWLWSVATLIVWAGAVWLVVAMSGRDKGKRNDPVAAARASLPACVTLYGFSPSGIPVGMGSGFIVNGSGLGVTSSHVLEGAFSAKAVLENGRLFDVVYVESFDRDRDLLVFQIARTMDDDQLVTPQGLPFVELGGGGTPRVGDRIALVGSPRGLKLTMSDGLVSGIRQMGERKLLQVSAPVSPGASGGAVFDGRGRVVGIVVGRMEQDENLGFAIPADEVEPMIEERMSLGMRRFGLETAAIEPDEDAAGEAEELLTQGNRLLQDERLEEAARCYRRILAREPRAPAALHNLALCLELLGKLDQAERQYRRFVAVTDGEHPRRADVEAWLDARESDVVTRSP